jgi:hypothetical protein
VIFGTTREKDIILLVGEPFCGGKATHDVAEPQFVIDEAAHEIYF